MSQTAERDHGDINATVYGMAGRAAEIVPTSGRP